MGRTRELPLEQRFPFYALELLNFWCLSTRSPAFHAAARSTDPCSGDRGRLQIPEDPEDGKGRRFSAASPCVCLEALEAAKWYLKKSHLASVGGKIAAGTGLLGDGCRNPGLGGKTPPSVLLSPQGRPSDGLCLPQRTPPNPSPRERRDSPFPAESQRTAVHPKRLTRAAAASSPGDCRRGSETSSDKRAPEVGVPGLPPAQDG